MKLKPSEDAIKDLGKRKRVEFLGKVPLCPPEHVNKDWYAKRKEFIEVTLRDDKTAILKPTCDISKLSKYNVVCQNCKGVMGTVYATDKKLTDWCSFRYRCWYNKDEWGGCRTPNVSPMTGRLRIECCCGQDTREILKTKYDALERSNAIGRSWGKRNSKFKLEEVKA